jgi:hypothetical protein
MTPPSATAARTPWPRATPGSRNSRAVRAERDPGGMFANPYLDRVLGGVAG